MSVRLVGPYHVMGPVAINTGSPPTLARGALVRVVGGYAVAVADAAVAGLAVALDKYPDAEYEGTKDKVDLVKLGEDTECDVHFSGAALAATTIGTTYGVLAANGGTVNLANTTNLAFKVVRFGPASKIGDTTGTVIGVFLDAVTF